jgi:hypothetical protein
MYVHVHVYQTHLISFATPNMFMLRCVHVHAARHMSWAHQAHLAHQRCGWDGFDTTRTWPCDMALLHDGILLSLDVNVITVII